MQFTYLFPTFFAEEQIDVDNAKIEQYCYQRKAIDSGVEMSNVGGWHSEFFDPWIPEINELTTIVKSKLDEVSDIIDFGVKAELDKCFINISKKGDSHKIHDHPGSFLSAVYYVDADAFRGNLVFHSDNRIINWIQNEKKIKQFNILNCSSWTVTGATGKLIIFPAWLKHEVTVNNTDKDRISIVYNCPAGIV